WTAGPAFLIAAVAFTILGLLERSVTESAYVASELSRLDELFWITPLTLIPLLFLVVLSVRKVPASLAILSSALLGGVMAVILQPQAVLRFVNDPALPGPLAHIKGIWSALASGYRETSGIPEVDRLVSRGGMSSMMLTVWIIIGAITFGTLLEEFHL